MGRIYTSLLKFFEDWFYTQNDAEAFLKIVYEGKAGKWLCFVQALDEQEQLAVYSIYPVKAAEGQRLAIAELITRLNYGLTIGNFELDFADGEIRFKTSLDATNTELTSDLIRPVVYYNVAMMDRYWPALAAVLDERATPHQAFEEIERAA